MIHDTVKMVCMFVAALGAAAMAAFFFVNGSPTFAFMAGFAALILAMEASDQ